MSQALTTPLLEVLPNGTRIEKCGTEPGDMVPDGWKGVIVARIGPVRDPDTQNVLLGYVIHWKGLEDIDCAIAHFRVRRAEPVSEVAH